jgi:hypothetical protein
MVGACCGDTVLGEKFAYASTRGWLQLAQAAVLRDLREPDRALPQSIEFPYAPTHQQC